MEIAHVDGAVAIRDSKDPDGPVLTVAPHAFDTFIHATKRA